MTPLNTTLRYVHIPLKYVHLRAAEDGERALECVKGCGGSCGENRKKKNGKRKNPDRQLYSCVNAHNVSRALEYAERRMQIVKFKG